MTRARSSRGMFVVVAVLMASVAGGMVAYGQQAPPVFRGGVELFEIDVSVLDRNRQPVRGLTAADFTVLADGQPQRIVQFSEVEVPDRDGPITSSDEIAAPNVMAPEYVDRRLVAIVLDDFGVPFGGTSGFGMRNQIYMPEMKKVARDIIQSLGPRDFAAVVLTRDVRGYPDFTNMVTKLTGMVDQMQAPAEAEAAALIQTTRGRIGMIATLRSVVGYMAQMPQHRKAIVYIGLPPSVDFARRYLGPTADRVEDLIRTAQAAGISISGFDVAGQIDRSGQGLLLALAENTGGRATGYAQLDLGIRQVFTENRSYYLLGFEPDGARDGRTRKLDVKVSRNGVTLRFPRAYTAPAPADMVKATPAPFDGPVDAAVTALGRALDTRRIFLSAAAVPGLVTAVAEISAREYTTGRWASGADVDLVVSDGAGVVVGTTQARIEAGTKAASLGVPLRDVSGQPLPASRGPFRVAVKIRAGEAVLEDAAGASTGGRWLGPARVWRGQGSARSPLVPTAEFQFSRTERLFVEWTAAEATDRREARLLRRSGEPTGLTLPLSDGETAGQKTVTTTFALNQLAPGEYVLEVVAGRAEDVERRLLPFRVVQ